MIEISPDGKRGVSAAYDGQTVSWDLEKDKILSRWDLDLGGWPTVFSADGERVLFTVRDGILLADWESQETLARRELDPYHNGYHVRATRSPSGEVFAFGTSSGLLLLEDRTLEIVREFDLDGLKGGEASFSEDGVLLTCSIGHGTGVRVFETATGNVRALLGPAEHVPHSYTTAALNPEGTRVALARESSIELWDVASQARIGILRGHHSRPSGLHFSADGEHLYSSGRQAKKWRVADGGMPRILGTHSGIVGDLEFSSDGEWLTSAALQELEVWEVSTGLRRSRHATGKVVSSLALRKSGTEIVTSHEDGELQVFDGRTGDRLERRRLAVDTLGSPALVQRLPNSSRLAAASWGRWGSSGGLFVLSEDLTPSWTASFGGQPSSLACAPDESWIAVGTQDGSVLLFEGLDWNRRTRIDAHHKRVTALAASADGQWMASASYDGEVRLWKVGSPSPAFTHQVSSESVAGLAFTTDGRRLLVAEYQGFLNFMDVPSGRLLLTWNEDEHRFQTLAMSPDGTRIAIGTWGGRILLFEIAP